MRPSLFVLLSLTTFLVILCSSSLSVNCVESAVSVSFPSRSPSPSSPSSPASLFPSPSPSSPVPILRWGASGHSIVASIAQSLLTRNASAMAVRLLPSDSGSLSAIASWADEVRREATYKWSSPLHFIDTPDWFCNYSRQRDCVGDDGQPNWCADGAIQNFTQRLSDPTLSSDGQTEALKFLVHFVGDIHQPLHVSFTTDEGGNEIHGTFEGESTNLHAVWDEKIIQTRVNNDYNGDDAAYTQDLINRVAPGGNFSSLINQWESCPNQTDSPYSACSVDWADESISAACGYAYVEADGVTHVPNGFDLEDDYYNRVLPIVEVQLAKAGVRLAHVLNSMFPDSDTNSTPSSKSTTTPKVETS